jgi:hypothetical protein
MHTNYNAFAAIPHQHCIRLDRGLPCFIRDNQPSSPQGFGNYRVRAGKSGTGRTSLSPTNCSNAASTTTTSMMLKPHFLKASAIAAVVAIAALYGCATSHVMVGQARPPISPDQVQIYLHPPANKYVEIALLDTSSRGAFAITAQGKTNVVIDRLKAEAAKLGANGILLEGVGDQAGGSVGTGFGSATATGHSAFGVGFGSAATVYHKKGVGLAIYVEADQVATR